MFCDDLIRHKTEQESNIEVADRVSSKKLTIEDLECAGAKLEAMKMEMLKVRCY